MSDPLIENREFLVETQNGHDPSINRGLLSRTADRVRGLLPNRNGSHNGVAIRETPVIPPDTTEDPPMTQHLIDHYNPEKQIFIPRISLETDNIQDARQELDKAFDDWDKYVKEKTSLGGSTPRIKDKIQEEFLLRNEITDAKVIDDPEFNNALNNIVQEREVEVFDSIAIALIKSRATKEDLEKWQNLLDPEDFRVIKQEFKNYFTFFAAMPNRSIEDRKWVKDWQERFNTPEDIEQNKRLTAKQLAEGIKRRIPNIKVLGNYLPQMVAGYFVGKAAKDISREVLMNVASGIALSTGVGIAGGALAGAAIEGGREYWKQVRENWQNAPAQRAKVARENNLLNRDMIGRVPEEDDPEKLKLSFKEKFKLEYFKPSDKTKLAKAIGRGALKGAIGGAVGVAAAGLIAEGILDFVSQYGEQIKEHLPTNINIPLDIKNPFDGGGGIQTEVATTNIPETIDVPDAKPEEIVSGGHTQVASVPESFNNPNVSSFGIEQTPFAPETSNLDVVGNGVPEQPATPLVDEVSQPQQPTVESIATLPTDQAIENLPLEHQIQPGENIWKVSADTIREVTGRDPTSAEILQLSKAIAQNSGVNVPEWGINDPSFTKQANLLMPGPGGDKLIFNSGVKGVLAQIAGR